MGLEDGAIGVAGLDCIRAFLASESWCSFGALTRPSPWRWRGSSLAVWALWREYGRAAKLRGAREAHSQFLAAAETSLDAFGLFESVRNDAGEIVDFRFLYVNANAERLAGTATVGSAGADAELGDSDPADELDVCQILQGGRFRRAAE